VKWFLAALCFALSGCNAENWLGGSVSDLFPLTVSHVDVLRNDEALQLSYYNNNGADIDLVARVTVALAGINLKPGTKIKLEGEYEPGHQRTTVSHMGGGEPERLLAPVKQGLLTLDAGGNPDEKTRGSFNMLFQPGDAYAAGRDLSGGFNSVALDAGFDPILPTP
jgi:hypothetical protein